MSIEATIQKCKDHYGYFSVMIICDDEERIAKMNEALIGEGLKPDNHFFFARREREVMLYYDNLSQMNKLPTITAFCHPTDELRIRSVYRHLCSLDASNFSALFGWEGKGSIRMLRDSLLWQFTIEAPLTAQTLAAAIDTRLATTRDEVEHNRRDWAKTSDEGSKINWNDADKLVEEGRTRKRAPVVWEQEDFTQQRGPSGKEEWKLGEASEGEKKIQTRKSVKMQWGDDK